MQKHAAELLRIKPTTLNEMIKRYAIQPRRRRGSHGRKATESSSPAVESHAAPTSPPAFVADASRDD